MGTAGLILATALPGFIQGKMNSERDVEQRLENRRAMAIADSYAQLTDLRRKGYGEDNPAVSELTNYIGQLENYSPTGPRIEKYAGSGSTPGAAGAEGKSKKGAMGKVGGGIEGMLSGLFMPRKFSPVPILDMSKMAQLGIEPSELRRQQASKVGADIFGEMSRPEQRQLPPPRATLEQTPPEMKSGAPQSGVLDLSSVGGYVPPEIGGGVSVSIPPTVEEQRMRARGPKVQAGISALAGLGQEGAAQLGPLYEFNREAFQPLPKEGKAVPPRGINGFLYEYDPPTNRWEKTDELDPSIKWSYFTGANGNRMATGVDPRTMEPITVDTGKKVYVRPPSAKGGSSGEESKRQGKYATFEGQKERNLRSLDETYRKSQSKTPPYPGGPVPSPMSKEQFRAQWQSIQNEFERKLRGVGVQDVPHLEITPQMVEEHFGGSSKGGGQESIPSGPSRPPVQQTAPSQESAAEEPPDEFFSEYPPRTPITFDNGQIWVRDENGKKRRTK